MKSYQNRQEGLLRRRRKKMHLGGFPYCQLKNFGEFRDAQDFMDSFPCALVANSTVLIKRGGFTIIRHNSIRNFKANLIKQVTGDATCDDERQDIRARSIWRNGQNTFFDISVANTIVNSWNKLPPTKRNDSTIIGL